MIGQRRIASFLRSGLAVFLMTATLSAAAENWPSWRGPLGNGVTAETKVATKWSQTENVLWRAQLPGPAGATPVLWGDRLFLTAVEGDDLLLLCYNTRGDKLWSQKVGSGNQNARTDEGNSASPSPVTDGKHVWAFMGNGDLGCYDVDGKEVWKFNLQDRYGKFEIQFGMTSTPVLYEDKIYLQIIHGQMRVEGEPAYVVALDKSTGKQAWYASRKTNAKFECKHSYASPVLYDDGTIKFLLTHGADYAVAYDLASGKELWRHGGLNPLPTSTGSSRTRTSSRPGGSLVERLDENKDGKVVASELTTRLNKGMFERIVKRYKLDTSKTYTIAELKKLTGTTTSKSKKTASKSGANQQRYHNTLRFVASPAVADGLVIVPSAKGGPVQALRPNLSGDATGKKGSMLWQMNRGTPDVPSPLIHDGLVYLCGERGILTVVDAKNGEEVYSERLHNQRHRSSPVYAAGNVYMCARDGVISVVKAGRKFELVAQNKMEEILTSSLVISNGTIYVRTFDALYAIR